MTCKLADDSVVRGKVLHEDGRDFRKISRTSGSCGKNEDNFTGL